MTATESGRVQVVYTANVGSPLAADVAAGATVITVDDTSDFDTDGTLQVAGETIDYSAVDDDTGEVSLAWAVTGTADAGDIVTLWDTGLDQAAVEYRAHVALPGVLDNADAVDATIRHTLIGYLDEGIRNPGTGESVRMERHGSDWVIVDLFGKQPRLPGGGGGGPVAAARFIDIQLSPSYGAGGIIPSELNTSSVVGDPSCWVYDGAFGVQITVDGWYQASADGHVYGLNDGDQLAIELILRVSDWFGELMGSGTAPVTGGGPGASNVWLSATSPTFYAHALDIVSMSVNTVNVTSSVSVIEECGINLVRIN